MFRIDVCDDVSGFVFLLFPLSFIQKALQLIYDSYGQCLVIFTITNSRKIAFAGNQTVGQRLLSFAAIQLLYYLLSKTLFLS